MTRSTRAAVMLLAAAVLLLPAIAPPAAQAASGGTLLWWGNFAAPDGLTDVVAADAAMSHGLALRADGTVVQWGSDPCGADLAPIPDGLADVTALSAGDTYNWRSNRTAQSWRGASGSAATTPFPSRPA